ncbi:hypothetical protein ABEB36_005369 [Hypothenemus hampei]|uniref:Uncharacterized protein n=1 Tax=Hypothenemus hampei TaxID=57062 RepID=A0ABD1EYK9_HYPHA
MGMYSRNWKIGRSRIPGRLRAKEDVAELKPSASHSKPKCNKTLLAERNFLAQKLRSDSQKSIVDLYPCKTPTISKSSYYDYLMGKTQQELPLESQREKPPRKYCRESIAVGSVITVMKWSSQCPDLKLFESI